MTTPPQAQRPATPPAPATPPPPAAPPTELTITIDGKQFKTRPGKMVLEACIDAGVYVPYLCYHPGMKPFGACRMCVVEIDGQRGTPASCTVPVADGMVVRTQS